MKSSTGIVNFTTKVKTILTPPSLPQPESLRIFSYDVGNSSGTSDPRGMGHTIPSGDVVLANSNGSTATNKTLPAAFADGVLVECPLPFSGIRFTASSASSGAPSSVKYWNGSSFATLSSQIIETPDTTSTSEQVLLIEKPLDWAAFATAQVASGFTLGKYGLLMLLPGSMTLSAVEALNLLDYVEIVADGNSLTKSFEGGLQLPITTSLFVYGHTANAANWATAEYNIAC
jgi:hypothetical protein